MTRPSTASRPPRFASRRSDPRRWPARRRGVEAGRPDHRLRPEGTDEGAPPTEDDGSPDRLRRRRDLHRRADVQPRAARPIQAPLGRRDAVEDQAEYILVSLDTFHDRLTAYAFGVTRDRRAHRPLLPAGRRDHVRRRVRSGLGGQDAISSATAGPRNSGFRSRSSDSTSRPEQIWGLNVQRSTPTLNEMDYWVPVPRTQNALGLPIRRSAGIEGTPAHEADRVLPYVAGASTVNGNRDPGNPFDDGRNLTGRAGADLKMGIGPTSRSTRPSIPTSARSKPTPRRSTCRRSRRSSPRSGRSSPKAPACST